MLQVLNIHEANENFDTKQLCRFIAKHLEMKFDVLVMGGAAENTPIEGFEPVFTDTCVKEDSILLTEMSISINKLYV